MIKFLICCGLPGSGKTTFAKEKIGPTFNINFLNINNKRDVILANFDLRMKKNHGVKSIDDLYHGLFQEIRGLIAASVYYNCTVILDGLFIRQEDYLRIAKEFKDFDLAYHWW